MYPRTALTRVQLLGDLDLALRILQPRLVIAFVNRVFTEILITGRLGEQNVVLFTKLDPASRPAIAFVIKPVVLITAGCVSVDLRDHRCGKRADTLALRGGRNNLNR